MQLEGEFYHHFSIIIGLLILNLQRRFIQIPTSGIEKFITFNELPPFEIVAGECDKTSKDELLKIGFNLNNALWLTTCAQLAYKDEEVIYDVCKNVWGTSCFFLLGDCKMKF